MTIEELQNEVIELGRLVRRHVHDGIETEKLNSQTALSTPSGSGWELVSYTTSPNGAHFLISDLDLDTDIQYHILIQIRNQTAGGIVYANCNSDTSASSHAWASQGYHSTVGETNSANELDTKWELNMNAGNESHMISLFLGDNGSIPLANWDTGSVGYSGDATRRISTTNGAGFYNSNSNITSFLLTHNSGTDCEWRVWVFKAKTG